MNAARTEPTTPCTCRSSGTIIREGVIVCAACGREPIARARVPEYYDQHDSPLGRRRHVELARAGKFPSTKEGRRILVLRSDMQKYLEREGLTRGRSADDEGVDDVMERITKGKGKGGRR